MAVKAGTRFTKPGTQVSDDLGATWRNPIFRVTRVSKTGTVYYGEGSRAAWKTTVDQFEQGTESGRIVIVEEGK